MKNILETERLFLREFNADDEDFIIKLLNTPQWLKFIGDRNVRTKEEAQNYLINGPLKSYKTFGFGLSLVALKTDHTPVGMCGLLKRENLDQPDLGFAFLPEFTGNGYAFEITSATINYAKGVLNLPAVLAITIPENVRSVKLLEKIGFQFENKIRLTDNGEELLLYKIDLKGKNGNLPE